METARKQVLFLVDLGFLGQLKPQQLRKQHARAICLSCCRILLHLSDFPAKDKLGRVNWGYQFLHSDVRGIPLRSKVHRFQDVRSELLESFYKELEECTGEEVPPGEAGSVPPPAIRAAANLIYNGLASAVQDCLWEAPELTSPVRPRMSSKLKGRHQRGRSKIGEVSEEMISSSSHNNLIFLFSWLPKNQTEMEVFCHQEGAQQEGMEVRLRGQLLPAPLITQLINKNIALHWVESRISWKREEEEEVCDRL